MNSNKNRHDNDMPTPTAGVPPYASHPAFVADVVSAARDPGPKPFEAVNLPVWRASSVLFSNVADMRAEVAATAGGERRAANYATAGTPTTFALAEAVAQLEAGAHPARAALMPSGLSAIATTLQAFLSPGDHLLMSDSVYGPARLFAQGMLARFGIETTFYDPCMGAAIESLLRPTTRMVYLESPGSYTFEIQDTPAICAMARRRGVLTAIDNAWASPVLARPFDWGVDMSVLPLTKYWSGHADVLMGATVVREALWPQLHQAVRQQGLCVGGDDAWLILRGMRTLEVRMRAHERHGLEVARWLQGRPEVARVLHPALESHPQHHLWKRDFLGASGLFAFELNADVTPQQVEALCDRRAHLRLGFSWGGFESLIMPANISALRTATPWRGGPLIRLHAGLDAPALLMADLEAGFDAMRTVRG
ncbi:cystathionine beta-lyase [Variovorax boronicumulans]|uniref:Cystathionine beta-lyase n=1 Tax=Variovorax boronicumulans TaxID=436515 RepID=A0AAW8DV56_9BURK|nr:cystathionine beta-lyase [Variovorax boronicumulans]MDP9878002.1 cystathionine beta-lyase [Variovorax boronicumulans]MDP9923285.1 cystathionine beta-lyase [Variovorax boronicumulans]